MIYSMTGFGKAELTREGKSIRVELRSLNSRYFDLNLRTPLSFREKESEVRSILNEKLQRGKIDAFISIESGIEEKASINKELVMKYYTELRELSKDMNAGESNLFTLAMQMPEVMNSQKPEEDPDDWNMVKETLMSALNDIMEFRLREGKELENALKKHVMMVLQLLKAAEQFESERRELIRTRLRTQLQELISADGYDRNRFEQELIYYIERLDFTEEKVRLRSHCDFFLKTLDDKESNGRRLGFISQEIGREINTLGSKANHAGIQKFIVLMKDELEKIKEQLLNVL
ncbi:MAG: YicC/YloC family endoribonuclease [Chitinophagales bacterium]